MTELIPHYFNIDLFFQIIRCSELGLFYVHLLSSFTSFYYYERQKSYSLVISFIVGAYLNNFFKNKIARPIFSLFNDYIPIFGLGSRPEGAEDCGYFTSCPRIKSSSFGFPSGHSQFAGLYSGFMIRDTLLRENNLESFSSYKSVYQSFIRLPINKKINIILYFSYILVMMYTRVCIQGCHTLGQTIFGALIGLVLGFFFNKLFRNYLHNYENRIKYFYYSLENSITRILNIISIIILMINQTI